MKKAWVWSHAFFNGWEGRRYQKETGGNPGVLFIKFKKEKRKPQEMIIQQK